MRSSRVQGPLTRVAPWALVAAQSWLLDRLLRKHAQAPTAYEGTHTRLDSLEKVLRPRADDAPRESIDASGPDRGEPTSRATFPALTRLKGRIIYRPVTLRNGSRFEVAIDLRRLDPITLGIIDRQTWFLDDYYWLLDRMRPGDRVLDLGGHVGTFALAAAALGCEVACVEAAPDNLALIEASIMRNGFDRMRVVWGAVTDREGTLTFLPH
jgi:hypothetical protein